MNSGPETSRSLLGSVHERTLCPIEGKYDITMVTTILDGATRHPHSALGEHKF